MIVENHRITYRNVASKLYNFLPVEIDIALTDFNTILNNHGYHGAGPIFFSILSDPTAEVMTAQLFLPIKEDLFTISKEEGIEFSSYFHVNQLIMTRIKGNYEEESQMKYWELSQYMGKKEMIQKTPVFVEYKKSHAGDTYVEMSVGVL
jgi:hypothetical protein